MAAFERIGLLDTWPVEFGRDGNVLQDAQVQALLQRLPGATDLLAISHGWNNDEDEATALYRELLGNLSAQWQAFAAPPRRLLVLRVYWPSKRFAEEELIAGGAASAVDPTTAVSQQIDELLRDLQRPGTRPDDDIQRDALAAMQRLLPRLDDEPDAQEDFVRLTRLLLSRHVNDEEDVLQQDFYASDGTEVMQRVSRKFRPPGRAIDGATSVGAAGAAGAVAVDNDTPALGNLFRGALNGARNLLNLFTYYEMKERAGLVGSTGLADVLRRLSLAQPAMRLHLCGHSFGGRLVTAALAARPPGANPVAGAASLTLLQAAFSHNAIGVKYDSQHDGFFRGVFDGNRLNGPVVVTHTERDRAVGLAYPIASRLRNQVASGIGDAQDPYGAIGRNGALFVPAELDSSETALRPVGQRYAPFGKRRVYNLHGGPYITGHSDVRGPAVAQALLHALLSTG
jgi:hypothetical protein